MRFCIFAKVQTSNCQFGSLLPTSCVQCPLPSKLCRRRDNKNTTEFKRRRKDDVNGKNSHFKFTMFLKRRLFMKRLFDLLFLTRFSPMSSGGHATANGTNQIIFTNQWPNKKILFTMAIYSSVIVLPGKLPIVIWSRKLRW